jgi:hypothetical protein
MKPTLLPSGLHAGQELAITLLMTEPNLGTVASKAGVSRSTLFNWLKHDDMFRLRLSESETETLSAASRKLMSLCLEATSVLEQAMAGDKIEARQLQAASITLKRAPELLEAALVHARLVELERRLAVGGEQ